MAAFPHNNAGNAFQATFAIGVLAAMMRPVTPMGWRAMRAIFPGVALVVVFP